LLIKHQILRAGRKTGEQQGYTLLELVVMIVLLGVAIPSFLGLFSQISFISAKNKILDDMMVRCESRMEEIIAHRQRNWAWYKNPQQYAENTALTDNFTRTVTVTPISSWGSDNVSAWEVVVNVSHPNLPAGYSLTVRLTQLRI